MLPGNSSETFVNPLCFKTLFDFIKGCILGPSEEIVESLYRSASRHLPAGKCSLKRVIVVTV